MARQNRVNATYLTDREKEILNFVWSGLKN